MPDHMTAPRPAAEPARLAAALVALLLALGCIASCGVWGLAIWRSAHAPAPPAPAAARWQEFARTAPRLFPSAQRSVAAPTRYRLWGVIGGGTRAGAALIGVGGGTPHAYKVGADVEAGVRLVETSFGRAVLLRDGVRETLATSPGTGSPGAARQGRAAGRRRLCGTRRSDAPLRGAAGVRRIDRRRISGVRIGGRRGRRDARSRPGLPLNPHPASAGVEAVSRQLSSSCLATSLQNVSGATR